MYCVFPELVDMHSERTFFTFYRKLKKRAAIKSNIISCYLLQTYKDQLTQNGINQ